MREIVLLKQGEIALKGNNRSMFEDRLVQNVRRKLRDIGEFGVRSAQSTMYIRAAEGHDYDMQEVFEAVADVFGIASLCLAAEVHKSYEGLCSGIEYLDSELKAAKSFKVEARRADKKFPMKSPEICRELGGEILERYPHLMVDVHNPEVTVMAEIRDFGAYIHGVQTKGAGGMPVGTSGRGLLLLSGGIDSPVAGYMMAKRGLFIAGIHFESPPYTSPMSLEKVENLAGTLTRYVNSLPLFVVSVTKIWEAIAKHCPEEYYTLIIRRFMVEIASRVAAEQNCGALITGESLAQVASQTLAAMTCTEAAADIPVLRPLIGMDKEEIVALSRKIGTFELSTQPYEDCCTVFLPAHPRTNPKLEQVLKAEEPLLPIREQLISDAIAEIKVIKRPRATV